MSPSPATFTATPAAPARVLRVTREGQLKQRLETFAPELHPDKSRIIEFGRVAHENRRARGQGKPETFAFLGFTHIFGRTREGRGLIRRHTVRERLNAKLRQVKATCAE